MTNKIERVTYKSPSTKNIAWFRSQRFSLPFHDEKYRHPKSEDLRELRIFCSWSQSDIAQMAGVSYKPNKGSSTVRKWLCSEGTKENRKIPFAVWRLLLLHAKIVDI